MRRINFNIIVDNNQIDRLNMMHVEQMLLKTKLSAITCCFKINLVIQLCFRLLRRVVLNFAWYFKILCQNDFFI